MQARSTAIVLGRLGRPFARNPLLADSLLGLAVLCRGAVGYCDTLRMQGQAVELTLPLTAWLFRNRLA